MTTANRRGRPPHPDVLTPTEWRIVDAVRHGMGNRMIARARGISLDAVKFHIENAVGKLGLDSRAGLRNWRGAPFDSALGRLETNVMTNLEIGPIGQIARWNNIDKNKILRPGQRLTMYVDVTRQSS